MVGTAAPTTIAGASVLQIGSDKLTEANSNGQLVIGKNNGSSTRKFRLGLDDNYHLSMGDFGHSNDNTYAPQVTIRWDNGNVGIGVPVPTEKLEVQGMVKAIREAGRTPVQRGTFYETIKTWDSTPATEAPPSAGKSKMLEDNLATA